MVLLWTLKAGASLFTDAPEARARLFTNALETRARLQ
jgi:hypothetical protein